MGWDTTRNLRFYPKNGDIKSIDIKSIIENISRTVRSLCSEVVYSENHSEKCYDLKFNSSKLSGEVVFNKKTTEVWDLLSFEEGGTLIGNISNMVDFENTHYEIALFTFDEVRIQGNQRKLEAFYKEFIPTFNYLIGRNKIIRNNSDAIVKMAGFYSANNQHYTGNEKRRLKTKKTSCLVIQDEFQKKFRVCNLFEDIVPSESNWLKLKGLIEFLQEFTNENIFDGLKTISFLYKNRIVKQIEWIECENKYTNRKEAYWHFSSSDWWENCANPIWREFRKNKEINRNK